jgi:hypothetical protein
LNAISFFYQPSGLVTSGHGFEHATRNRLSFLHRSKDDNLV